MHKVMSAVPLKATKIADIAGPIEGRALLLCPVPSNFDLLRYCKGIIHVDAEIPDGALYLGMTEQKLHGSQIPGAAVDEGRFSSPQ